MEWVVEWLKCCVRRWFGHDMNEGDFVEVVYEGRIEEEGVRGGHQ